jgi:hypothetical protein
MQPKLSIGRTQDDLWDEQTVSRRPMPYGWSTFDDVSSPEPTPHYGLAYAASSQPPDSSIECAPIVGVQVTGHTAGFVLPKHNSITIAVIAGPSKGLTYRFTKPLVSVGRTGGRADIEIDDPGASGLHCAVGVRQDAIRLCDLDSTSGTYVNEERIQASALEHLSEFRVGSSLLLITVLPKRDISTV